MPSRGFVCADSLGKPNPATFPFSKISITLNGPEEKTLVLDEAALAEALQYGLPAGHSGLIKVCAVGRISDGTWTNTGH